MATFTNDSEQRIDIPLYGLSIAPGDTFEVDDDIVATLHHNPAFTIEGVAPATVPDPGDEEPVESPAAAGWQTATAPQPPSLTSSPAAPGSDD